MAEEAISCVTHEKMVKFEWKMKNFFDLPKEIDYYLESPIFKFDGAQWCLGIYPNGRTNEECRGSVSVYLRKKYSSSEVRVTYTVGVMKADGSVFESSNSDSIFPKQEKGLGFKLCTISRLLNSRDVVAPDGILIVFCTVRMKYVPVAKVEAAAQTLSPDDHETLSKNFKDLFLSRYQADVTFKVHDKDFVVHRNILAARSTVFRSMFELDMTEKNSGVVNIEGCTPEVFEKFLLFIYSGNFDLVTVSTAMDLCLIADKYNVMQLKKGCLEKLVAEISAESVCDIVYLASLYNEHEILKTATNFFIDNFNAIVTTPRWLSFLAEHTTSANELLVKMANKSKT